MEKYEVIIYFISFLFGIIIILKILFESNLHKLFKQGRIFQIRMAYFVIAIVFSHLLADAIWRFLQAIITIII